MTIEFDPRARGIVGPASNEAPHESDQTSRGQSLDSFDPYSPAQSAVSEMDLLFSGVRRFERIRQENPMEEINIPGLDTDILGRVPILGSTSRDLNEIIRRYNGLKRNLTERRNNYAHALEGPLRPEEVMDLYDRIEQLDQAIAHVTRELEGATRKKEHLENYEERLRLRRIEEEENIDEQLADLQRRSQP